MVSYKEQALGFFLMFMTFVIVPTFDGLELKMIVAGVLLGMGALIFLEGLEPIREFPGWLKSILVCGKRS